MLVGSLYGLWKDRIAQWSCKVCFVTWSGWKPILVFVSWCLLYCFSFFKKIYFYFITLFGTWICFFFFFLFCYYFLFRSLRSLFLYASFLALTLTIMRSLTVTCNFHFLYSYIYKYKATRFKGIHNILTLGVYRPIPSLTFSNNASSLWRYNIY